MKYNLVFLINEKNEYARHLAAVIASIMEQSKVFWNIYIIYTELSRNSKEKLMQLEKKYHLKLNFIQLQNEMIEQFELGKGTHLNKIVFGRLFLPNIISDEERAIYMDIDMIVNKPLEEVYEADLENFSIGAIPDGVKDQKLSKRRLKFSEEKIYFNAGLMLMDLKKLRKNGMMNTVIEYCANPDMELKLNEQDGLNIIFENDFKELPQIWNCTHGVLEEKKYSLNEIGIIHYTGEIKPWDCRDHSPFKNEYWKYLNMTPWKGYKEENFSFKNIVERELTRMKLKTRKYRYILKKEK